MSEPSVSIIIRCYNEEQHIGRLLSGIVQQTYQPAEIIIVDSGSTDATLSIAARFPTQIVTIAPEAFSFGRSLNIGCAAASGEILAFASAHVYPVYKDWLAHLVAPFADSRVALVYGRQRGNETTKYTEHQIFAAWFPPNSNLQQDHPFCNNANAAVRRSLWQELPYDESLTGLEDLDWAKRALARGHYLAYVAEAEVVHLHDETPARIYNRYRREAMALKRIFPEEQFTLGEFARLLAVNVLSDYRQAWREGVFWPNWRQIVTFRSMQFWGTYRGFARRTPVTGQLKETFYYPVTRRPSPSVPSERAAGRIDYASPSAWPVAAEEIGGE